MILLTIFGICVEYKHHRRALTISIPWLPIQLNVLTGSSSDNIWVNITVHLFCSSSVKLNPVLPCMTSCLKSVPLRMESAVRCCCIIQISQIICTLEHSRSAPEPEIYALQIVKQHSRHYLITLAVVCTLTIEQIFIQTTVDIECCVMDYGGLVGLNHWASVSV